MKIPIPILTAAIFLAAAPTVARERPGHDGCGHCGGGYNANVNVNVNASASASASAYSGAYINAQAYDVRSVGARGPVYGGVVSTGGHGYGSYYSHSDAGFGRVVIGGPGYGPSRPHGYVVYGFGRRYGTVDQCSGGCRRVQPPPACHERCHGDRGGHSAGYGYSAHASESWSVRESYSERSSWSGGRDSGAGTHDPDRYDHEDRPRYTPIPYHAAPLEPRHYDGGYAHPSADYAPPPVHYSEPEPFSGPDYGPQHRQPEVYPPARAPAPAPLGYYGDLPPGDSGEGMPYRQEPGERG